MSGDLTCRKLREGAGMGEKYGALAWFSDQISNWRAPEGTEKNGKGGQPQRGNGETGTLVRLSRIMFKLCG